MTARRRAACPGPLLPAAEGADVRVLEVRLGAVRVGTLTHVANETTTHLPPDLPEAFGQTLAVRRFDRPGTSASRVHVEDFAQVFGVYPADKYGKASYGNLARMLWLETGEEGVTEYVRRLVFNVLIGNGDAHLNSR